MLLVVGWRPCCEQSVPCTLHLDGASVCDHMHKPLCVFPQAWRQSWHWHAGSAARPSASGPTHHRSAGPFRAMCLHALRFDGSHLPLLPSSPFTAAAAAIAAAPALAGVSLSGWMMSLASAHV
jgi:hypothetical protein